MFLVLLILFSNHSYAQNKKPQVLYFCSVCDQFQMASAEDQMTQAAAKAGVGVVKFGNINEFSDYNHYKEMHPDAKVGNLVPIKSVQLGYDPNTWPKNEKGWAERRQKFAKAREDWIAQVFDQLNKMDKNKPIVLHMGNHGLNPGENPKPGNATFMCMYGLNTSSPESECISYDEFGKMMEKAGLTGDKAPPVRIIGDHCYGGGVHYLSTKFSNVCSASIVGYKTPQNSPGTSKFNGLITSSTGIDAFGTTFWRSIRQSGNNANLADAYNSAWGTVPMTDRSGGTLSSVFYVQQVMGLSDEKLPTHNRLPSINQLERSFLEIERLKHESGYLLSQGKNIDPYDKSRYTCEIPKISLSAQISSLEKISQSLDLSSSLNIYQQAIAKAKDTNFMKTAQQNKLNLDRCYTMAQASYDKASKEAKAYMEKSKWSAEFFFKFEDTVNQKKQAFARSKEVEKGGKILDDFKVCIEKNAAGVRDYLNTVSVLNRLGQLEAFSKKATSSQKSEFRKKVLCESSPLF